MRTEKVMKMYKTLLFLDERMTKKRIQWKPMQAVVSGYRQPSICICSNVKAGHIDFQSGCR